MNDKIGDAIPKRNVAYKLRVGSIVEGKPVLEGENHLKYLEVNAQRVNRVNLIANVIDKYIQDSEKKFGSLTLDDGSGQIKIKVFGDDIEKFTSLNQGDTVLIIGLVRYWNNETYITPEIIKKKEPSYLLVRKLEVEKHQPKALDTTQMAALKEKIIDSIKDAEKDGGIDIETMILNLAEPPQTINQEIKKLLEDGVIYEPRPGKLRYLGQ